MKVVLEDWSAISSRDRTITRCRERGYKYFEIQPRQEFFGFSLAHSVYLIKLFPEPGYETELREWLAINDIEADYGLNQAEWKLHGDFYGDKLRRLIEGDLTLPLVQKNISRIRSPREGVLERGGRRGNKEFGL